MGSTVLRAVHGRVAIIEMDYAPVNALGLDLRGAVVDSISWAVSQSSVRAIVLTGGERVFSAGADVREFGTPRALEPPNLRAVIEVVEESVKPVIAAVAGACLGGGLELALGCHFRIAKSGATVALPEVKLGILPGAGGTQRLPRAVGLERALRMIVSGETVRADDLAGTPLFDEIVDGALVEAALDFANRVITEDRPRLRLRDRRVDHPRADTVLAEARERACSTLKRLPAPLRCIEAVGASVGLPFEEGLRLERRLFDELMSTPESKALRHVFAAERAAARVPGVSADTATRPIGRVGVLGAGTMGRGIAMSFLDAGLPVVMVEVSREALDRGLAGVRGAYQSSIEKGRLTRGEADARLAMLRATLDDGELAGSDLIVEAVIEDFETKRGAFVRLDALARPGAILASNTSTLDLNQLAAATRRPQDVVGLHFFSPAHVMRLLEVVRGDRTGADVLATCFALAKRIRKIAVVSGVCDGFIGNRMLHRYAAVAEQLVVQGALPQQVDRALEDFGMAMGPFRVGDLAGLDVGWAIRKHRARRDPGQAAPRIADRLCEAGRFGQKIGAGWYRYERGKREPIADPVAEEIIASFRRERGVEPRRLEDSEIVERCIFALVDEGARILDEGIAVRASDIDVVYLNGYGFPAHRGGPMFYASELGLQRVVAALQRYAEAEPAPVAPLLARLAEEGGRFG